MSKRRQRSPSRSCSESVSDGNESESDGEANDDYRMTVLISHNSPDNPLLVEGGQRIQPWTMVRFARIIPLKKKTLPNSEKAKLFVRDVVRTYLDCKEKFRERGRLNKSLSKSSWRKFSTNYCDRKGQLCHI